MTSVRHLEKLWKANQWGEVFRDLLAERPEASPRLQVELQSMVAAAALGMIRLEELNQTYTPLFARLLRTLLRSQDSDGGWRDPITTALCVRALLIDRGAGVAIDRAIQYLAQMQKPEGIWPREPLRRMPADPFASAFILFQLGGNSYFRAAIRFDDAVAWFENHPDQLDEETTRVWSMASLHCHNARASVNARRRDAADQTAGRSDPHPLFLGV